MTKVHNRGKKDAKCACAKPPQTPQTPWTPQTPSSAKGAPSKVRG